MVNLESGLDLAVGYECALCNSWKHVRISKLKGVKGTWRKHHGWQNSGCSFIYRSQPMFGYARPVHSSFCTTGIRFPISNALTLTLSYPRDSYIQVQYFINTRFKRQGVYSPCFLGKMLKQQPWRSAMDFSDHKPFWTGWLLSLSHFQPLFGLKDRRLKHSRNWSCAMNKYIARGFVNVNPYKARGCLTRILYHHIRDPPEQYGRTW